MRNAVKEAPIFSHSHNLIASVFLSLCTRRSKNMERLPNYVNLKPVVKAPQQTNGQRLHNKLVRQLEIGANQRLLLLNSNILSASS